MPITKTKNLI